MSVGQTERVQDRLEEVLAKVERPLMVERSVKLIGSEMRDGRRLVSFPRAALGPGPSGHLRRIAQGLGAPAGGFAGLDALQSRAVAVHLGVEPERTGLVWKLYLEFGPGTGPEPDLVFLALKWRGEAWTHSYYRAGPADLDVLPADLRPLGASLVALRGTKVLLVDEPGTPRRSIDINLSDANNRLSDHRVALLQVLSSSLSPYLDRHGDEPFGHFAAGVARDGKQFATIYHGAHLVDGSVS